MSPSSHVVVHHVWIRSVVIGVSCGILNMLIINYFLSSRGRGDCVPIVIVHRFVVSIALLLEGVIIYSVSASLHHTLIHRHVLLVTVIFLAHFVFIVLRSFVLFLFLRAETHQNPC